VIPLYLSIDYYTKLYNHVQLQTPHLCHFKDFPHLDKTLVFSPWIIQQKSFVQNTHRFSTFFSYLENSSISFYTSSDSNKIYYGFIHSVWIHFSDNNLNSHYTFILVSSHPNLSYSDEKQNLYKLLPGLQYSIVYTHNTKDALVENMVIIELHQIVGHVAYYSYPVDVKGHLGQCLVSSESLIY